MELKLIRVAWLTREFLSVFKELEGDCIVLVLKAGVQHELKVLMEPIFFWYQVEIAKGYASNKIYEHKYSGSSSKGKVNTLRILRKSKAFAHRTLNIILVPLRFLIMNSLG